MIAAVSWVANVSRVAKGRKRSQVDSRRRSGIGRDRESLRGEIFAKHSENKGQKREQADVFRRWPAEKNAGSN